MAWKSSKTSKIAILSLINSLLRVGVGPITLLFIGASFTNEELGFYYAFFGVVGMKMLFEGGMSNVLKLTYSHFNEDDWNSTSHLFIFSIIWYFIIAIVLFVFLYYVGGVYFSAYEGDVLWSGPWTLLCLSTSFLVFISFIETYLDGSQKQIELKCIQIFNSVSVFSLWIAMYYDMGLYSLPIMQIVNILISLILFLVFRNRLLPDKLISNGFSFKQQFLSLSGLLKKVFLVWISGYFFWNGFNLLAFKLFTPEIAGLIGFSLALGKAGYSLASSVLVNQMTLISRLISEGKESLKTFNYYLKLSLMILISGYFSFFILNYIIPEFYIFDKVLPMSDMVIIFIYFTLIHIYVSLNNYVRSYKVEPFVFLSFFNALGAVGSFLLGGYLGISYFLFPAIFLLFLLLFSYKIFTSYSSQCLIIKSNG